MEQTYARQPSASGRYTYSSSVPMASLFGSSPPALGSSPPSSFLAGSQVYGSVSKIPSDKLLPYAAAKKFWKRIVFDPSLDPSDFSVGFIESVQQQVRQSGAGAWSLRLHDQLHDIPYNDFLKKFPDKDIPFHRIVYFKHCQALVWESDSFKKKLADDTAACGGAVSAMPPRPRRISGGTFIPGSSPPKPYRQGSDFLFSDKSAVSGDLLGGSSDDEEDGEGPSCDDWDPDDMVAGQMDGDGLPQPQQEQELQLPEECWLAVLHSLAVREVCMMGRVNRWLYELSNFPDLWSDQYKRIFGEDPQPGHNAATVRRMCRRSEIRAARWLEADVQDQLLGHPDTACLQLDDAKVVSGDGQAVRVWSHVRERSGRRIATLKGHTGTVTSVAYDNDLLVSGCSQGGLRIWGMDDLKCSRAFRTAHEGGVAGVALLNGIPVSGGADGCVRLWDVASAQPIMSLELPRGAPVRGLDVQPRAGYIISCSDGVQLWDAGTVQLLHDLVLPDDERDMDAGLGTGMVQSPGDPGADGEAEREAGNSFECVAYSGSVLAAGLRNRVVLWDPRCAKALGSAVAPWQGSLASRSCAAVQLDDWKLVAAFNRGPTEGAAVVYDLRGVSGSISHQASVKSSSASHWQPLQVLNAPARICSMKFHNELLMAGLSGKECILWSFLPPTQDRGLPAGQGAAQRSVLGEQGSVGMSGLAGSSGAGGSWGGELLGRSPPQSGGNVEQSSSPPTDDLRRGRRGKPAKMVKKQNRYPKRSK